MNQAIAQKLADATKEEFEKFDGRWKMTVMCDGGEVEATFRVGDEDEEITLDTTLDTAFLKSIPDRVLPSAREILTALFQNSWATLAQLIEKTAKTVCRRVTVRPVGELAVTFANLANVEGFDTVALEYTATLDNGFQVAIAADSLYCVLTNDALERISAAATEPDKTWRQLPPLI